MNNNLTTRGFLLASLASLAVPILVGSRQMAAGGFKEAIGCAMLLGGVSAAVGILIGLYQLQKTNARSASK